MKKVFYCLLFLGLGYINTYGQSGDFCNALSVIMRDAPNKFRNIRGKLVDANANATIWACGIQVPGTLKARFVASMGLFYEGAFLQTQNKDDIKAIYQKYSSLLDTCLLSQGYSKSLNENYYPGLADYRKVVYMLDAPDETMPAKVPPAHVTLEVTYNKDIGLYTVVLYIYEH